MGFEGRILSDRGIRTLFGIDAVVLQRSLEEALSAGCSGVVSIGTAGGLDPALAPGSWVVGRSVITPEAEYPCDGPWADCLARLLSGARAGVIAGVDGPVATVQAKQALYSRTGALAADMESAHTARLAARYRVPFAAARVVIDPAKRALPKSALVGLRRDGSVDLVPILVELGRHPGQILSLLRLARDAAQARGALETGVDRLGARLGLPE
jgi:hopanoid-associated phosphorylase